MTNTKSTQIKGKWAEYKTIAEFLKRGYDVYIPLVDERQIDCVIRRGNNDYVELQIKGATKDSQAKQAGLITFRLQNPRPNYFFLFYVEHIDTYWIIPSIELPDLASRNKTGKNVGDYTIQLTKYSSKKDEVSPNSNFSKYEDNFDFLNLNT